MRQLSSKRLLQFASLILAALTALVAVLWAIRGLRPALDCGVLDTIGQGDWRAARACIDLAEYDALLFIFTLGGSVLAWIASRKASDKPIGEYNPTPAEQTRNRQVMIDRTHAWIDDQLDQRLYQAVLMSLGMIWRAAVLRPGSMRLRRPGEMERPVPAHVPTVELFDEAQHRLLILGEPGTGKTTMMIDLAHTLVEQARNDATLPIPVVFNLSSLIEPEQSLDDWLVGELRRNYDVPEKLALFWLAHEELTLLLDGLDEVHADRRSGVVAKLNQYRSEHLAPSLVICCRNNEYTELSAAGSALEDVDAVVLQPLTRDQTEDYLAGLDGPEPQRLWNALKGDTALLEVADTPLMLNVMLLAANELDWGALPSDRGPEAVRSHTYDAYIRSMLARSRGTGRRYPVDKTLHWLHWLAGEMLVHSQTVFLLERMNRSWFNRPSQRSVWNLLVALVFGLLFGLVFGLTIGPVFGLTVGLAGALNYALLWGLFLTRGDIDIKTRQRFKLERSMLAFGLVSSLVLGILFGLVVALVAGLVVGMVVALVAGLVCLACILPLMLAIMGFGALEDYHVRNQPNAAIRQSLRSGLLVALVFGLVLAVVFALVFPLVFPLVAGLANEPAAGLVLVGWPDSGLVGWPTVGRTLGLYVGLSIGLFAGCLIGLRAVTKHYALRLVLFFDGSMPLDYVRFLDDCADRVFLRRVGGGYIFIHRTFMEHVVSLDLSAWQTRLG